MFDVRVVLCCVTARRPIGGSVGDSAPKHTLCTVLWAQNYKKELSEDEAIHEEAFVCDAQKHYNVNGNKKKEEEENWFVVVVMMLMLWPQASKHAACIRTFILHTLPHIYVYQLEEHCKV